MINRLKRVASATVSAVMILSAGAVFAAEVTNTDGAQATQTTQAVNSEKSQKIYMLEKLGIMQSKDEAVYTNSIKRADFAYILGKLLKQKNSDDSNDRYFIDVADYDFASPYINALTSMKIISTNAEKKFEPQRSITGNEAIKMVITALGYNPLAVARGGYPMGYRRIAQQIELLDGLAIDGDGDVTWEQAGELLFNALLMPQYIPTEISNGGDEIAYTKSNENTLLKELYGMEFVKGTLTGSNGSDIKFDVASDENSLVADGVKCKINGETEDYTDYLGKNIYAFYTKDEKKLYYLFEDLDDKNEELIINIEDVSSYNNGVMKYYDGDKEKSVDLTSATVLYNKAIPQDKVYEIFSGLTCGEIRLIKIDGSGYSTAIISDCKPFVLKFTDTLSETLYSLSDNRVIKLREYEKVNIKDEKGANLTVDKLAANSVMNVYASAEKERIDIFVTMASIEGIASTINSGDGKITVDSKIYEAENTFENTVLNGLNAGSNVRLYLDKFGKVIYAKILSHDGMETGYLIAARADEGGFDDVLRFKICNSAGEVKTYESADSLSVDGVNFRMSGKKALAAIPGNGQTQLIKYSVNSDGKIRTVDTYLAGNEDQDSTLTRTKDGSTYMQKYWHRLGKDVIITADTKFFCVPTDDKAVSAEDSEFSVVKCDSLPDLQNLKLECYKEKGENAYTDAIVYRINPSDLRESDYKKAFMFLVEENSEAIDENGEEYRSIAGMYKGTKTEIKIYEDSLINTNVPVSDIAPGDILRYRNDYKGKALEIDMLYDRSANKKFGWENDHMYASSYTAIFQISSGYISDKNDSVIGWSYTLGGNTDERINATESTIMVYDEDNRNEKVYKGNYNEIRDYKSAGNECDMIFVQYNQGYIQSVILYKGA